jgi:hypothetical protein
VSGRVQSNQPASLCQTERQIHSKARAIQSTHQCHRSLFFTPHSLADASDDSGTRRKAERQLAEVYVPSSFMFGDPRMDSEQIVYREGHDIDAALARGKHQAVELARQCWDELVDHGFPEEDIAPLVFRPWYEAVLKWATGPVEPRKISAAPRPEEFVPGQIATA